MVNSERGIVREGAYCGLPYRVSPGMAYGHKQFWQIEIAGEVLTTACMSLSKAAYLIHNEAVRRGAYARAMAATSVRRCG